MLENRDHKAVIRAGIPQQDTRLCGLRPYDFGAEMDIIICNKCGQKCDRHKKNEKRCERCYKEYHGKYNKERRHLSLKEKEDINKRNAELRKENPDPVY